MAPGSIVSPKDSQTTPNPQDTFTLTTIAPNSFWGRRRSVVRKTTLRYQLDHLRKTGRFDQYKLRWHPSYDVDNGLPALFWDSDIGKWIEAACYFLMDENGNGKDDGMNEIESAVREVVEDIRGAQMEDGYLNVHYQIVEPGMRWTNLRDKHELYNCGHLLEGALAHHKCFNNDRFLQPMIKYIDLLCKVFGNGPGQMRGYPGHPEIELALLRLYKVTHNPEHLRLARFFLDERGNHNGEGKKLYYELEAKRRGEVALPPHLPLGNPLSYYQADRPVVSQTSVEGHSVRCMYLMTGVADLCLIDRESKQKYLPVLQGLWDNMVQKKMYLTGGIGAEAQWEGFSRDYWLPQGLDEGGCYAETCAAIGVVMLAERLLQLEQNGHYADIMELSLYNALLTGMSHDGTKFTYTNRLASSDGDGSRREDWFDCACCPPNVLRNMGFLGGYLWNHRIVDNDNDNRDVEINVYLYASATLAFKVGDEGVKLTQETEYPRDGKVAFHLDAPSTTTINVTIKLRIPAWAKDWSITPALPFTSHFGFLTLPPSYLTSNPRFTLTLPMMTRLLAPHPYTNQPIVAIARGPLIYCAEDVDNSWVDDHFKSICLLKDNIKLKEYERDDVLSDETIVGIRVSARKLKIGKTLESAPAGDVSEVGKWEKGWRERVEFVPYYARANRGGREMMRVGFRVL